MITISSIRNSIYERFPDVSCQVLKQADGLLVKFFCPREDQPVWLTDFQRVICEELVPWNCHVRFQPYTTPVASPEEHVIGAYVWMRDCWMTMRLFYKDGFWTNDDIRVRGDSLCVRRPSENCYPPLVDDVLHHWEGGLT